MAVLVHRHERTDGWGAYIDESGSSVFIPHRNTQNEMVKCAFGGGSFDTAEFSWPMVSVLFWLSIPVLAMHTYNDLYLIIAFPVVCVVGIRRCSWFTKFKIGEKYRCWR